MIVYISAFALSIVFGFFAEKIKNSPSPKSWLKTFTFILLAFLCFLAIFLPAAFRKNIGTDYWFTYVPMLEAMRKSGQLPATDLVVKFFFWIVLAFNLSNQWFFLLTSLYINAFVIIAIFVNKKSNIVIALGIYFLNCIYFASLSNIRQMMGAATALLAFSLIANSKSRKNIIWGLILSVISGLCHYSCWISTALFIFCLLPWRVKAIVPITLVVLIMSPALSVVAIELLKMTKYAYFLDSFGGYGSGLGALGIISPDIVLLVLTLILMAKKKEKTRILIPFMLMKAFAVFAYVLTLFRSMELFIRLYHIFFAFDIIYVPILMEAYMSKSARIIVKGGTDSISKSLLSAKVVPLFVSARAGQGGANLSLTSTRTFASDVAIILPFLAYAFSFFIQEIISSYFEVLPYHSIWG